MGDTPKNLEDAFEALKELFGGHLERFEKDSEADVCKHHHTVGQWIRNNWGLWKQEGGLYEELAALGLHHADDMSGLILDSFWRHLHDKPLEIDAQVSHYKAYWARAGKEGP